MIPYLNRRSLARALNELTEWTQYCSTEVYCSGYTAEKLDSNKSFQFSEYGLDKLNIRPSCISCVFNFHQELTF